MNRQDYIILGIIFIIILLGSLGLLIYNVFDNTAYPDEAENWIDTISIEESEDLEDLEDSKESKDSKNLTQLTLQDMQQKMTKLSRDYRLPPSKTKFQCLLPPLAS